MRRNLTAILFLLLVSDLGSEAAVVVNDNIRLGPGDVVGSDFALTIFQDEAATDETTMWFDNSPLDGMVSFVDVNIDESSDWYLTSELDEFTAANVIGGSFPVLVKSTPTGFEIGDIDVGSADFFLGVNTGNSEFPGGFLPRNVFGWVHLQNTRGGLMIVGSAINYGGGIIVGTSEAIPEPSVLHFLFGVVFLALLRMDRRRRLQCLARLGGPTPRT